MIDISGDIIYFDGRPVGFITVPNGTLRGAFEEALTVDIMTELEEIMGKDAPCEDLDGFFDDVKHGEIVMSDEIDSMCKKLSAIYELIS